MLKSEGALLLREIAVLKIPHDPLGPVVATQGLESSARTTRAVSTTGWSVHRKKVAFLAHLEFEQMLVSGSCAQRWAAINWSEPRRILTDVLTWPDLMFSNSLKAF